MVLNNNHGWFASSQVRDDINCIRWLERLNAADWGPANHKHHNILERFEQE